MQAVLAGGGGGNECGGGEFHLYLLSLIIKNYQLIQLNISQINEFRYSIQSTLAIIIKTKSNQ